MKLKEILKEMSLENRIEILEILEKSPLTISKLRAELRKVDISKPYTTISRYIEGLKKRNLICEYNGKIYLTAKGRLVLLYFKNLNERISSIDKLKDVLFHSLSYLPDEIFRDIHVLQHARVLTDHYVIAFEAVAGMQKVRKRMLIASGSTISPSSLRMNLENQLKSVYIKNIVDEEVVDDVIETFYKVFEEMELSEDDIERIKKSRFIRVYKKLPIRILVTDYNMAGISLPPPDSNDLITPSFQSTNKEFVRWVERIFNWFWERSKPVDWWFFISADYKGKWMNILSY